ncbi:MAG: thioredoxin family protein, partial [Puniceicoccales bacterium]|nr:thioredoxin family protein [Puniceicoccales bacterium]
WHTYGKDPGDAGFATSVEWTRTGNASPAAEWLWPVASPFQQGNLRSFGYEGETVILIPLAVSAAAKIGDTVVLDGTVSWLECDERTCVPREGKLALTLAVGAKPEPANAAVFAAARSALAPAPAKTDGTDAPPSTNAANGTDATTDASLVWEEWSAARQQALLDAGKTVYVDFTARWCLACQLNKRVYGDGAVVSALRQNEVALLRADWTKKNPAIAGELARYNRAAIPFNVFLRKDRPPVVLSEVLTAAHVLERLDVALGKNGANADGTDAATAPDGLSVGMLLFGFLGGLVLNLMPCVFPVLGLKIMNFVAQAGESRRRVAAHGLVFTAGVVGSFWLLAGLLRFLRAGGWALGWGFQLQAPGFVLAMAVLLLVLGLNMAGVFEVGGRAVGAGAALTAKGGLRGSFFSGILAVVVATPCSAPFLGVALGTAIALPPVPSFAIFTTIALGLAAPYLLLSLAPQWVRLLPRPGAWMESLKQGLSFLLFGSVLYLLWVLAAQVESGSLTLFLGMGVIAFACWVYGRWTAPHLPPRVRIAAGAVAAVLFFGTCAGFGVVLSGG